MKGEADDDVAAGGTAGRGMYSVALLIMRGGEWTLEAQAFAAESHYDAQGLGLDWARRKHPGADRYFAHTCVFCDSDAFAKIIADAREHWAGRLAALEKEIRELRGEPEAVPVFGAQESDKAH